MKLFNYYNLLKISIFFSILIHTSMWSQNKNNESLSIKKASILSSACPGLGQIYNKKYWKAPVIYVALGTTVYYYCDHNTKYKNYKSTYINRINNPDNINDQFSNYTNSNLITLQDYHRNSRDLSGLIGLFIYVLNIIDASVDAHLTHYNINDDLSLYLTQQNNFQAFETLNISLKLKYNL